jgi:hypothetical protein
MEKKDDNRTKTDSTYQANMTGYMGDDYYKLTTSVNK